METSGKIFMVLLVTIMATTAIEGQFDRTVFLDWDVSYITVSPLGVPQQVIAINGMFPGPLLNTSTNWNVLVNVHNYLDEPFLMTWNGIHMIQNTWQDGSSGTNCPIPPGQNWTYFFQVRDQVGSFFYSPSTLFQRASGGFGIIQINPTSEYEEMIKTPIFTTPDADFPITIGDWYINDHKALRASLDQGQLLGSPAGVLINGKGAYHSTETYEKLTVIPGQTYRFRISNVGVATSLNFRIQGHQLYLVETEGYYTIQKYYDSLDIHVGQSYSVLVTADKYAKDYYIVASPRFVPSSMNELNNITGIAILNYSNSTASPSGALPDPPSINDSQFSLDQARSIRRSSATAGGRPNPQGTFDYGSVNITQTYHLYGSAAVINDRQRFAVNDMSYMAPFTPLSLADYFDRNGIFKLNDLPADMPQYQAPVLQTSVIDGVYRGSMEMIFQNTDMETMQTWQVHGYSVVVLGYDTGIWTADSRRNYNNWDAISRSNIQVFPNAWTAVLIYLDNEGMWSIHSQNLQHAYLGEEFYMRVHNPDDSRKTEVPPPPNVIFCGELAYMQPPPGQEWHSDAVNLQPLMSIRNLFIIAVVTWIVSQI